MPGNALVISGGTAKGAYAAGLIHRLFSRHEELRSHVRYFSGTSTGALIVPILALYCATGKREYLDRIPAKYDCGSDSIWRAQPKTWKGKLVERLVRRRVGPPSKLVGHLVEEGAGLDTEPLHELIEREYPDETLNELFAHKDKVEAIVNCVSAQTGRVEMFSSADPEMTPEIYRGAIYASCLQPIIMPLFDIDHPRIGRQQYMDGGIRDVIPIRAAWYAGANRVFAIALSEKKTSLTEERYDGPGGVPRLLLRVMLGLLNQEVADDDINEARYIATIGRLARFVPKEKLDAELSLIGSTDRPKFQRDRLFDDLYVHRPEAALSAKLSWSREQMQGWIADGEVAADGDEGQRIDAFLMAA
ncbi:MAG: patatin-like phospholipase family protein [Polyangiales bacterium]